MKKGALLLFVAPVVAANAMRTQEQASPHRVLALACEKCHNESRWTRVKFAHAATMFPLSGRHAAIDCGSCHRAQQQGGFFGLTTACVACHQAEMQMAKDPDHRAMGFPVLCGDCHQWLAWTPAAFAAHAMDVIQLDEEIIDATPLDGRRVDSMVVEFDRRLGYIGAGVGASEFADTLSDPRSGVRCSRHRRWTERW